MFDAIQPGHKTLRPVHGEYKGHAHALTADSRENLPDVATLKKQPHRMGVILRALAVWDPYARPGTLNAPVQIAQRTPMMIEEIEDVLSDHKIWGFGYYIAKGASAVVNRIQNNVIRITTEDRFSRIKSRHVLQAEDTAPLGNTGLRYEKLRLAETSYIFWHHTQKVYDDLALEGNLFWDKFSDNVGCVDGKACVLDGGATWSQEQVLEHKNDKRYASWLEGYKAIRRKMGMPEFPPP